MPYRLRIKFAAQQFLRLPALFGQFSLTGKDAVLRETTTQQPSADEWELISGGYSGNDTRAGPEQPFHHDAEFIDSTGEVFISWRLPSYGAGTNEGTFMFSPSTGLWRRTNTEADGIDSNDNYRALGQRENYAMCYDPDNDYVWISPGSPSGIMPSLVSSRYDVATDIFYSVPTANFIIVNGRSFMGYHNGRVYCWRPEGFKYYNIAAATMTSLTAPSTMQLYITSGTNTDLRLCHQSQHGVNRDQQYLWNIDINCDLWKCDLTQTTPSFTKITTSGTKPATPYAVPVGMACAIDESRNKLVAYISKPTVNPGYDTGVWVGKTWVLDLTSYEWSEGPSVAGGDTVPDSVEHTQGNMLRMVYDRQRAKCLLLFPRDQTHEVWQYNFGVGDRYDSFTLPVASGSTYGVNYYGFPFTQHASYSASKNVNMAYCPDTNRLYASGGDFPGTGSDTPGIWSMSMDDGTWRLESGLPNSGSAWAYAQPNGYQDGTGFWWSASRSKFIFGFHCGESYETQGVTANWQYARGVWFFDPSLYPTADAWTQDLTLLSDGDGTYTLAEMFERPNTGSAYGGWYDETTDTVYAFPTGNGSVAKYNVATMTKTSAAAYTLPAITGYAKYFAESGPVGIGRDIYTLGYYTNNAGSYFWKLLRWNIDSETLVAVYDAPAFVPRTYNLAGIKLEKSNGKVVFINHGYPEGDVANIFIWSPSTLQWTEDTARPSEGTLYCNAHTSLPDGRIAMCGAQFNTDGGTVTRIYFYTAP